MAFHSGYSHAPLPGASAKGESCTPELFVKSKCPVLFVSSPEQKTVNELLIHWWRACVFLGMGADSELELVLGSDCWEVDPAVGGLQVRP